MAKTWRWRNFLEWLFPVERTVGSSAITIEFPAELYYKELAVYTATSLISNAISRSEVKSFVGGKPVKEDDYYHLNVSPNKNETSSIFWHKVINKMIYDGEALIIETENGSLYCADSFNVKEERPFLGNIYDGVTVGDLTLNKVFTTENSYIMKLNDMNVNQLISGMYDEYGKVISSAAQAIKKQNGTKYKLKIDAVKAGDEEFNKLFKEHIEKQVVEYLKSETAVYPQFEGYELVYDDAYKGSGATSEYIALQEKFMKLVAAAFHIPESMMSGNITSIKEVVGAFLTFGADPFADVITEALNKRAGVENFKKGNYYKMDTSKVQHQNIFDTAVACTNLISSGIMCVDEVREELGIAPLDTEWSKKHFITKNFEEVEKYLKGTQEGGEQ